MSKKPGIPVRLFRITLISGGAIFLILCLLALTTLPFWAYYRLATSNSKIEKPPSIIVMLAGAGIPSENGLIRSYYSALLADEYQEAIVIVAVPGNINDSLGDPQQISKELILRGVQKSRIQFASNGKNTRGQALEIAEMVTPEQLSSPLTIVTSPEHMQRSVKCFRKSGFKEVSGFPAFEMSLSTNLVFSDKDMKGNRLLPPIGKNLQVRYQFWNHLKYEILVIREYFALSYYKIRGWI